MNLHPRQQAIIAHLAKYPDMIQADLCRALNIQRRNMHSHLKKLKTLGLIQERINIRDIRTKLISLNPLAFTETIEVGVEA